MARPKTTPPLIAVSELRFGDQFKLSSRQHIVHLCQWIQPLMGPGEGKILVMTSRKKPLVLLANQQLVLLNPPKEAPKPIASRLPKDLKKLRETELHELLRLRTAQLCQNTDLSAHLVDLVQQEVSALQEELAVRKNQRFSVVFTAFQELETSIKEDAIEEGAGMGASHHRARALCALVLSKAHRDAAYCAIVHDWVSAGKTSILRDHILRPIGLDTDQMTDFDAFVLLDDLGISLREKRKEVVNG